MSVIGEHRGSVTALAPGGPSQIISAGRDRRVILWDVDQARPVITGSFGFWTRSMAVSEDRSIAALVHKRVAAVSLPGLAIVSQSRGGRGTSKCAALSPDGQSLITGQFNGQVVMLTRQRDRFRHVRGTSLPHHEGQVRGIEFLPRRSVLVTAGSEGTIRFFAWENKALMAAVRTPGERLTSLEVSADASFMAVGDTDNSMTLWDLRSMDVPLLIARPLGSATLNDLPAISAVAADTTLPETVRRSLRFMEITLRHRFRHDIQVQDLHEIRTGEFDIEIE